MGLFTKKINEDAAALAELQASFAALQGELDAAREATIQAEQLAATLQSEFARVDEENKANLERIAQLDVELAEASRDAAEFDSKVAASAAAQVAAMGHAPLDVVEDSEPADLVATFKNLRGNEMVKFYRENKADLQKALRK